MRRVTFLLRMWVLVGALLLLLAPPGGDRGYAEYSPGSCINYAISQPSCPSGCTNASFTQMTLASGNGVYYLAVESQTPCGSAKQGQTCNQPTQYWNIYDFSPDCCAALGGSCTGVGHNYMNCCDADAACMMDTCCITLGDPCDNDSDCCTGFCDDIFYTCEQPGGGGGGGCNDGDDCPVNKCCNIDTGLCEACQNVVGHALDRTSSPKLPTGPSANPALGKVPFENRAPMVRDPGKGTASGPTSNPSGRK
jgi:hypothetical protein